MTEVLDSRLRQLWEQVLPSLCEVAGEGFESWLCKFSIFGPQNITHADVVMVKSSLDQIAVA